MKAIIAALIAAFAASPVLAHDGEHHDKVGQAQASASSSQMTDGEVRKVDKEAQKLTIRHGPMPQFDMPQAMTMVYRVKDAAMLEQVKPGDKIKFEAEKLNGAFTVTKIEPAR